MNSTDIENHKKLIKLAEAIADPRFPNSYVDRFISEVEYVKIDIPCDCKFKMTVMKRDSTMNLILYYEGYSAFGINMDNEDLYDNDAKLEEKGISVFIDDNDFNVDLCGYHELRIQSNIHDNITFPGFDFENSEAELFQLSLTHPTVPDHVEFQELYNCAKNLLEKTDMIYVSCSTYTNYPKSISTEEFEEMINGITNLYKSPEAS